MLTAWPFDIVQFSLSPIIVSVPFRSRLYSADNDDTTVPCTWTARLVRAVSASQHPRFGSCCHLISRTLMLVANSSNRVLRLGSLCKPTHKRRLWELCSSGTLQILDLIDWLKIYVLFICQWSPVSSRNCWNNFQRPDALLDTKPIESKHWRQHSDNT